MGSWEDVPEFVNEDECFGFWMRHEMGPGLFETPEDYAFYVEAPTLQERIDLALFATLDEGKISSLSRPFADRVARGLGFPDAYALMRDVYGPD